jgi:hypothetical protein
MYKEALIIYLIKAFFYPLPYNHFSTKSGICLLYSKTKIACATLDVQKGINTVLFPA